MGNPTALSGQLSGGTQRTPEEHRAKADELLARIEDEELIPQWCWARMLDTVAHLTDKGDDLAWMVPTYLSHVVVRGHAMFNAARIQASLLDAERVAPTRLCDKCGEPVTLPRPVDRSGQLVQVLDCAACGRESVMFGEHGYGGPTLITKGVV